MKENRNIENSNSAIGIIEPISIKINRNYLEPFNNLFKDELTIPENLSDKDKDSLKKRINGSFLNTQNWLKKIIY